MTTVVGLFDARLKAGKQEAGLRKKPKQVISPVRWG